MQKPYQSKKAQEAKPVTVAPEQDVRFVLAGVQAALNTPDRVRANVITDISKALNCSPEELAFLFTEATNDDPTIYDFPDSERRRAVLEANGIAAE